MKKMMTTVLIMAMVAFTNLVSAEELPTMKIKDIVYKQSLKLESIDASTAGFLDSKICWLLDDVTKKEACWEMSVREYLSLILEGDDRIENRMAIIANSFVIDNDAYQFETINGVSRLTGIIQNRNKIPPTASNQTMVRNQFTLVASNGLMASALPDWVKKAFDEQQRHR